MIPALKGLKELLEQQVLRAHKVLKVLWVKVETKVLKERQVLRALKEQQAPVV